MVSFVDVIKKSQTPQRHGHWGVINTLEYSYIYERKKKTKVKNLKTPYY